MIKLHGFDSDFGLSDPSGFVLKVETYLQLANIPYERLSGSSYLRKAPKGKLPYIIDGNQIIPDSTVIFTYLAKNHKDLDESLTDEQRSQIHILIKFFDEHLSWCLAYSCWVPEHTWKITKAAYFPEMPKLLQTFVPDRLRKSMIKVLNAQGLGRHSHTEVIHIYRQALQSLMTILGEKDYFFGQEKPTAIDAAAYGFLAQFIVVDYDDEFVSIAREYQPLVDYVNLIKDNTSCRKE